MVKIFCHVSGATPDPFSTHHRFYTYAHAWYIFGAAETNEDTHGWQHLEHFELLEENVQKQILLFRHIMYACDTAAILNLTRHKVAFILLCLKLWIKLHLCELYNTIDMEKFAGLNFRGCGFNPIKVLVEILFVFPWTFMVPLNNAKSVKV